jgi:hypothetical protein
VATSTSGSMNLFLQGPRPVAEDSSIDLSLTGSTAGRSFEYTTLDLFLLAGPVSGPLNLFLSGIDLNGPPQQALNLFVSGEFYRASNSLDLILYGGITSALNYATITIDQWAGLDIDGYVALVLFDGENISFLGSKSIPLYIQGEGMFPGSSVASTYLNLILWTTPGSEKGLYLYLQSVPPVSNSIPLFMNGSLGLSTGLVNLFTFGKGDMIKPLKLFIRGYNA